MGYSFGVGFITPFARAGGRAMGIERLHPER
jgi:hypothetical protein